MIKFSFFPPLLDSLEAFMNIDDKFHQNSLKIRLSLPLRIDFNSHSLKAEILSKNCNKPFDPISTLTFFH
jgi:hypothetical protein